MGLARRFEQLRVWKQARALVGEVYRFLGPYGKGYHDYGFRDQMQRAAVSIMNNIAEGFERGGKTEFARFLQIAKASCGEVRSMVYVGRDLEYFNAAQAKQLHEQALFLSQGIAAMVRELRK
jgi:four helix bundle protein